MSIYKTAALAAIGLVQAKDETKSCQALAMSGGGTLGSYEAGALWGMYYAGNDKKEFEYDVVTGVSAGSINLVGVSVYAKGDEEAMVKDLSNRWATLKQDNLYYRWWPFGIFTGINWHSGLFNTKPLTEYIDNFIKQFNS